MSAKTITGAGLHWAAAAVITALIPHVQRIPWWESLVIFALIAGKLLLNRRQQQLPRWVLAPLAIGLALGVWASYDSLIGRSPGVALLVVMLAMKYMETRSHRDGMLLIFLSYFVIVTNFLFDQSIILAIYLLGAILVGTIALITLNQAERRPSRQQRLILASRMVLEAVPIMLILFLVFPRLPGPLWGLPEDRDSASTGLSDSMSPGQISELIRQGGVAFRVKFDNEPPPPEQRYWRGPVFSDFDGYTWRPANNSQPPSSYRISVSGDPVNYLLTLEPHNKTWVFALELVLQAPDSTHLNADMQLISDSPRNAVSQYRLRSYPHYRILSELSDSERALNLALPANSNPQAQALGRAMQSLYPQAEQRVNAMLQRFRQQAFRYTLSPPLLTSADSMDQFLFETQAGFCEHFASSFVFVMRAAGIPARVVTGYLGGEMNQVADYMIIRQSDAHAWAEVWLPNNGWTRVDPTAAVAPERVELGLESAIPDSQQLPFMTRDSGWLKQVGLVWDSLNNGWNQWVLGYGPELQQRFLAKLGLGHMDALKTALSLLIPIAVILLAVALVPDYWKRRYPHDRLQRQYQLFCRQLARAGLHKAPYEGAQAFATRAAAQLPAQALIIQQITQLYMRMHYGQTSLQQGLPRLRQYIRHLRKQAQSIQHRIK